MNLDPKSSARSQEGDDRYARALSALKQTLIPEGPTEEVLARTAAKMQVAASLHPFSARSWRRIMITTLKVAAASLCVAVGWLLFPGPLLVGAPVTYEEVAAKLQKAHSLVYTMTTRFADDTGAQSVRLFFKEPGRLRCETVPGGKTVVISDTVAARKLMIDPAAKKALLLEGNLPGESRPGQPDLAAAEVEHLRQLGQKKGEPMGEKTIGGIKAQGFRVKEQGDYERVVWANPQTRLPIQVDITGPFGDKTFHSTIKDIQLDPELDDGLFSLGSPAGYTLQKQILEPVSDKDDGSPEAAIIILLRSYAEKSAGAFPKKLDDWRAYGDALEGKPGEFAQAMRVANLAARAAAFLFVLKGAYGYRPDEVKLGDAEKVLLWYRLPGKTNYRTVHGDLRIKEASEDQVPSPLKPAAKS